MERPSTRRRGAGLRILMILTLCAAVASPLLAQEGRTQVRVRLPEVLVMRYWAQIEASVDEAGVVGIRGVGPSIGDAAGSVDLAVDLAAPVLGEPITGTMARAFAVHSISGSGLTQVSLRIEQPLAVSPEGGRVVLVDAAAEVAGNAGTTISFASPGLTRSVLGGLRLTLDTTAAPQPGRYGGIALRLVAENL